ncbi:MAG: phospholipase D-like domain-containing protein [Desulfobacterales bacterium]|jgi:hypothetical protein
MYSFRWDVFANDTVLRQVLEMAGVRSPSAPTRIRPLVVQILKTVGGPGLIETPPAPENQTAIALRTLQLALDHTLSRMSLPVLAAGYVFKEADGSLFDRELTARPTVSINRAAPAELEALPEIGAVMAERIVGERLANGRYSGSRDLAARVRGIGEQTADMLDTILEYDDFPDIPGSTLMRTGDLSSDLKTLMTLHTGGTPVERLASSLETIAVACADTPHPYSHHGLCHPAGSLPPPTSAEKADVRVLWGSEYYRVLPEWFGAASTAIDVCMFHIALPTSSHPTRRLLDALIDARRRNLSVRVLMDADRDTDPYRSTVINAGAKVYLEAAGVPVRFDPEDRLLHSKFIVIDGSVVIMGSHNWSAGSYFQFDDLSVAIHSQTVGQEQSGRFNSLWEQA